jgi:hypothetical protein
VLPSAAVRFVQQLGERRSRVFKSGEEKEAERRKREAAQTRAAAEQAEQAQRAEEERKRKAFLASPVGAATAAKEAGQSFFEVQLQAGGHEGTSGFGGTTSRRTAKSSATTLEEIEKVGWRLEHASYFFMMTSETSTDRVFGTGQSTAVNGVTIGVYLFRNAG